MHHIPWVLFKNIQPTRGPMARSWWYPKAGSRVYLGTFNRIQSRVVTGLLTGHNTLRRHLYLLGLLDSPLCRKCGVGEETLAHILCECEALTSLRHAYLGSFFWSRRILRLQAWGSSGTVLRLWGSHDSIWGTKGPLKSRPRCIGAERPWTQMQIYLSIYLSKTSLIQCSLKSKEDHL